MSRQARKHRAHRNRKPRPALAHGQPSPIKLYRAWSIGPPPHSDLYAFFDGPTVPLGTDPTGWSIAGVAATINHVGGPSLPSPDRWLVSLDAPADLTGASIVIDTPCPSVGTVGLPLAPHSESLITPWDGVS